MSMRMYLKDVPYGSSFVWNGKRWKRNRPYGMGAWYDVCEGEFKEVVLPRRIIVRKV
jgi:hypothetical protein